MRRPVEPKLMPCPKRTFLAMPKSTAAATPAAPQAKWGSGQTYPLTRNYYEK